MKNKSITITKQETRYILTDQEGHSISVILSGNKRLSIYRQTYFNQPFEFIGSKPEVVEAVAKLLLEAVKLVEK